MSEEKYPEAQILLQDISNIAIQLSDNNSEQSCLILFTVYNGKVIELYHQWYSVTQTSYSYYPKESLLKMVNTTDNGGYTLNTFIGINSECSSVSFIDSCYESAVDLQVYPDFWSGVSTIQDGVFYYYAAINTNEDADSLVLINFDYTTWPDEINAMNPAKSLFEITYELSQ